MHNQITKEDHLFIELLQKSIQDKNFKVELNIEQLSIRVADKIDISCKIMSAKEYPEAILYHVLVVISNDNFIPEGIEDNLAAFGDTSELAIKQGVANFMTTVFPALVSILNDAGHDEDITIQINNTNVLVHVNCGPIRIQGKFPEDAEIYTDSMFSLIKDDIIKRLQPKKINWMKLYISNNDGDFTGECVLNGEYLDKELDALKKYALSWSAKEKFLALKQFILFRVCDKHDDVLNK